MHNASGIIAHLAGALCVLALLGGCAQQPQTTGASQEVEQEQASPAEADGKTPADETDALGDQASDDPSPANAEEQAQADELAKMRLDEARSQEPQVTQDLQSFEDDRGKLVGLDFRLKSQESLARKILLDAHTEEISLDESASKIRDVLRYTLCMNPDDYVSKATEVLKGLESKGYVVVKFKNTWDNDIYKGINTNIKAPSGIVFELQLHTPDSFEVKENNHRYYEIARSEDATEEEVAEATRIMRENCANLEIPAGALEFRWE